MPTGKNCHFVGGNIADILLLARNKYPVHDHRIEGGDVNSVVAGLGSNHIVGIINGGSIHGGGQHNTTLDLLNGLSRKFTKGKSNSRSSSQSHAVTKHLEEQEGLINFVP